MSTNIAPLNRNDHKNVRIDLNDSYKHLEKHHMAPVIVHEIADAAAELPVVFIKNPGSEQYISVALLGLKAEENLIIKDGRWTRSFVPAGYTHYPLALVPNPEDPNKYTVTIDMDSKAVSEEGGKALFNEDGSETEFLEYCRKALEAYYKSAMVTKEFVATLAQLDLLQPQSFSFAVGEDKRNVSGLHIVDEKKLNELSDEQFTDLRKKNYLMPIYAHLISLKQTQRLVNEIPLES